MPTPFPATISGCLFGFRADELTGEDLDPVSSITNLVGGGAIVLSQTTESMKPTLHTNEINGKKALYFDGGDEIRNDGAEAAVSANAFTIIAVVKPVTSFGAYPTICTLGPGSGGRQFRYNNDGRPQFIRCQVGGNGTATGAVALNDWHVLTATYNDTGITYAFKTDRTANGSGPEGAAFSDGNGMVLGVNGGYSGERLTGYIGDFWFYDHVLSDEDWDSVVDEIVQFYGLKIDFAPHYMTSNVLPVPYVVLKSSEYGLLPAWHVFDDVTGAGYWVTNGTATGYIGIDIGEGNTKKLYSYSIKVNTLPEPNRAPKDWTMEGSNDNSNWDVLNTQTNQTSWGSGEIREFILDPAYRETAYRYFRLNVSANNGDTYLQCAEMYLYEAEEILAIGSLFSFQW